MRTLVVFALISVCLASCAFSAKKKAEAISALEQSIDQSAKKNVADTIKIKELLADYDYYYKHYPKDSLCPVYLMRSGDFYRAIGAADHAIDRYRRVYTEYPNYPKANFGLFLEGFTYETDKHDLVKSRELYNAYLVRYPDTKMAKDVRFLLAHLGMTPEQIMHEVDSVKKAQAVTAP
jgi:tetratricopeptide (TPR) repeat protein